MPCATRCHGVKCEVRRRGAVRAPGDVEQLSAADATRVRRHGMARASQKAGPHRPELQKLRAMTRRRVVGALATAWLAIVPAIAHAQSYPIRPVRIVVAFSAGGTTDLLARSVGQQLSDRLKQPFVVENKPGAGGNIGTEFVVRSAPDGYTLIVDSVGPIAVNPTLYKSLNYNPL